MTRTISIKELQADLSGLFAHLAPGDEVIVEEGGKALGKISPMPASEVEAVSTDKPRELGFFAGQGSISPDFDAPDPELEALFYEGAIESAPRGQEPAQ